MSIIISVLIAVTIGLVLYMWSEAHRDRVRIEELAFKQLPRSFHRLKIFFISDIHRRLLSSDIVETWRGRVDFVVIGGDLCERGVKWERIEENLKRLTSLAKTTFFVWGNNDLEVDLNELRSLFQKYGIIELDNKVKEIERNGEKIAIAGVDEHSLLRSVSAACDRTFSILVCHDPDLAKTLTEPHPFSLILSGHTHGGQIRFFRWGLKEKGTLHKRATYAHLISNGYGTSLIPLRLGAPAEMHILILKRIIEKMGRE